MDYKNTLNLPRTDFPMKADLVAREPDRLKKWDDRRTLRENPNRTAPGAEKFVLHDGPPFANGDVHIGTALNKILKDIIVKYKTLRGFSAPYVPGWDCHGLPIEFKVSQDMRKAGDTSADAVTIRKACEASARKYIEIQRKQFKRLGVLGDWDNPYLTLNKEYEADELRLFADIVEKGFRLSRQKAGLLEHPLPHRARRGRSRIPRPRQPQHLREISRRRPAEHVCAHLDDHTVDFARKPRRCLQQQISIRPGRSRG